jgi:ABC-type protease/lipase transport system fused ATPase/permease subunit
MAVIEHAARLANAHEFIMRLPKAYGTLAGERGVKLSGGEEANRLSGCGHMDNARALCPQPQQKQRQISQ